MNGHVLLNVLVSPNYDPHWVFSFFYCNSKPSRKPNKVEVKSRLSSSKLNISARYRLVNALPFPQKIPYFYKFGTVVFCFLPFYLLNNYLEAIYVTKTIVHAEETRKCSMVSFLFYRISSNLDTRKKVRLFFYESRWFFVIHTTYIALHFLHFVCVRG